MKTKNIFQFLLCLFVLFSLVSCTSLRRNEGYDSKTALPKAEPLVNSESDSVSKKYDTIIALLEKKQAKPVPTANTVWKKPNKKSTKKALGNSKFNQLKIKVDKMNDVLTAHGIKLAEIGETKYHVYRVAFALGSSDIHQKARNAKPFEQIKNAVLEIEMNGETIVKIEGYTDDDGSTNKNELDYKRAEETFNQVKYHRPTWLTNVKPTGKGPTNDYGVEDGSRCALIICEKPAVK